MVRPKKSSTPTPTPTPTPAPNPNPCDLTEHELEIAVLAWKCLDAGGKASPNRPHQHPSTPSQGTTLLTTKNINNNEVTDGLVSLHTQQVSHQKLYELLNISRQRWNAVKSKIIAAPVPSPAPDTPATPATPDMPATSDMPATPDESKAATPKVHRMLPMNGDKGPVLYSRADRWMFSGKRADDLSDSEGEVSGIKGENVGAENGGTPKKAAEGKAGGRKRAMKESDGDGEAKGANGENGGSQNGGTPKKAAKSAKSKRASQG